MSPAATITPGEASDLLLNAADQLFYERGIGAVSMADVRDLSGLSMRRVYTLASSKSDLVAQWLRYRHDTWIEDFRSGVKGQIAVGATTIDAIFDTLSDWMRATKFRGCGFINTYAESSELTDEHRSIIRGHKAELVDVLRDFLTAGALRADAQALGVLLDGAIVQAAIFQSSDPIDHAHELAKQMASPIVG